MKVLDKKIIHIFFYCGYSLEQPPRGGSNEYPHYMFLSINKENNVYPCKTQFLKWGLRGSKLYRYVFLKKTSVRWAGTVLNKPFFADVAFIKSMLRQC